MTISLEERVLNKTIIVKEQEAEKCLKHYFNMAKVRYGAFGKTQPIGFTFFTKKAKTKLAALRREACKKPIILVSIGNEQAGTISALIDLKNNEDYTLVNTCLYHINPKTKVLSLDAIKTLPNHRGKGVGAAVINFVKDIAISSGCKTVQLDSVSSATSFYQKMGFSLSDKSKQVCPNGTLKTMEWQVVGTYNTQGFKINELNLMMQRASEYAEKSKD